MVIKKASLYFGMTFSRRKNYQLCRSKPLTFFLVVLKHIWNLHWRIYIQLKYSVYEIGANVPIIMNGDSGKSESIIGDLVNPSDGFDE